MISKRTILILSYTLSLLGGTSIAMNAQVIRDMKPSGDHAVGDIISNDQIDPNNFQVCNKKEIFQYYSVGLHDDFAFKRELQAQLKTLRPASAQRAAGYITIRFVVNCSGEAGRFRIISVDQFYRPFAFNRAFTDSLLQVVMNYKKWTRGTFEGAFVDYYKIITFRIVDSHIAEILP